MANAFEGLGKPQEEERPKEEESQLGGKIWALDLEVNSDHSLLSFTRPTNQGDDDVAHLSVLI